MKSTIKIEMDFVDNRPVIDIKKVPSDDLRDKVLNEFFSILEGKSSWLHVDFRERIVEDSEIINHIRITAIPPNKMEEHAIEMKERFKLLK